MIQYSYFLNIKEHLAQSQYTCTCINKLQMGFIRVQILLRRGAMDTPLCDKVCQWLAACRWISPVIPVFSTNKADRHVIAEILLKVVLKIMTILLALYLKKGNFLYFLELVQLYILYKKPSRMINKIHIQRDKFKTLILRVVLRVPLVEQELSTYPEHLSSPLILDL